MHKLETFEHYRQNELQKEELVDLVMLKGVLF